VAIPRHLSEALGRLAAAEERFLDGEFLAPMPRGGRVRVRIAGVVCELRVEPAGFQGWGVWRPLSLTQAGLAREATLTERQRYLELFPRLLLILCEHRRGRWLAAPARRGDTRFRLEGLVSIFLVEGADRFEVVEARFDGTQCWFERPDPRHDPAAADYLRQALREPVAPEALRRRGLTAEERDAYARVLGLRAAAERDRTEARLRRALAHGGAELRGYAEHADGYRVEYEVDGRRHVSSVGRDLAVQVAGICLSGEDHRFDLHSLVGVLREAQGNVIHVGDDSGGMDEDTSWHVHPRQ
jgi:hypothetical protein